MTVIALVSAFGAAGAGAVTAWKKGASDNITTLQSRVERLEVDMAERDAEVSKLLRWKLSARTYIYDLLATLAEAGIEVPVKPKDWDL